MSWRAVGLCRGRALGILVFCRRTLAVECLCCARWGLKIVDAFCSLGVGKNASCHNSAVPFCISVCRFLPERPGVVQMCSRSLGLIRAAVKNTWVRLCRTDPSPASRPRQARPYGSTAYIFLMIVVCWRAFCFLLGPPWTSLSVGDGPWHSNNSAVIVGNVNTLAVAVFVRACRKPSAGWRCVRHKRTHVFLPLLEICATRCAKTRVFPAYVGSCRRGRMRRVNVTQYGCTSLRVRVVSPVASFFPSFLHEKPSVAAVTPRPPEANQACIVKRVQYVPGATVLLTSIGLPRSYNDSFQVGSGALVASRPGDCEDRRRCDDRLFSPLCPVCEWRIC